MSRLRIVSRSTALILGVWCLSGPGLALAQIADTCTPPPVEPIKSCTEDPNYLAFVSTLGGVIKIASDQVVIAGGAALRHQSCIFDYPPLGDAAGGDAQNYFVYLLKANLDRTLSSTLTLGGESSQSGAYASRLVDQITTPPQGSVLKRLFDSAVKCYHDMFYDHTRNQGPYRNGSAAGGVRASITFPGISIATASPGFLADFTAFPEATPELSYGFLFSFTHVGDGDWLEVVLDGHTLWAGVGTDYVEGALYEASIPSSLVAGRSGLLAFVLHSVGDAPADVVIGDTEGAVQDPDESFTFTGFLSPVDNPPTTNASKAGSAIPVKFSLGGYRGLDVFAAGSPSATAVQCSTGGTIDLVEETATAGNSSLTYDEVTGIYTYVWKTSKEWAGSCRELQVLFADGQMKRARFTFRR